MQRLCYQLRRRRLRQWSLVLLVTLALALCLSPTVGSTAKPEEPPRNLHPALWALSRSKPDARVPVIVQKADPRASSQAIAKAAGVSLEEDYGFIGSLKLSLPAGALAALARNPAIRHISPDGPVGLSAIDPTTLETVFPLTSGAAAVWSEGTGLTGRGVTVAIIDSGISLHPDISDRVTHRWSAGSTSLDDSTGHGTHVAGIIAGRSADGRYVGIAPDASLVSVKVSDDSNLTSESRVVKGLEWVYNNKTTYNIRIVNMSLSAQTPAPYVYSPLAAAVEKLWQSGIVVVVAAGNRGSAPDAVHFPPANDPFVLTVGALDDGQTPGNDDDSLAIFSGRGLTQNGHAKPDVVAPGRRLVAPLASSSSALALAFPERVSADGSYIRLSGTSMAAPVAAGLAALILQRFPDLTPSQVKWALTATAAGYGTQPAGTGGRLDVGAALALIAGHRSAGTPLGEADQGLLVNPQVNLLTDAGSWETTDWSQAQYTSEYSESSYWETAYWETAYWETAYWETTWGTAFDDGTTQMDATAAMSWD